MKLLKRNNSVAFCFAVLSSLFLFISGTTGFSSWLQIERIVFSYISFKLLNFLFYILLIVASFGAFAVLIGGILIFKNKVFLGKSLVLLGSGAGVIGLIFNIYFSSFSFFSFSSIGVIFAVIARLFAKKK